MNYNLPGAAANSPVARLGATHGYAIDGDSARLNADLLIDESRLCGQQWSLQLWADEAVKVAELPLGLLPVSGSGYFHAEGVVAAFPPAGDAARSVALLLVNDRDGVCDRAVYAQPLYVEQPRLQGTVCCSFVEEQIALDIAAIANPRAADNLSGTLALELWALDAPYAGGAWRGTPVASLVIGSLAGQSSWTDCHYRSHAAPLPAAGHLTLMLREWTAAGYLTRDYRELARPAVAAVPVETVPAAPAKAAKSEKKAAPAKSPAKAASGVSVNAASAAELGAVKGVSKTLAAAIVAGRPYKALDDLLEVKGMGKKLLERLRADLKL